MLIAPDLGRGRQFGQGRGEKGGEGVGWCTGTGTADAFHCNP
jgi:hypothetical protein